MRESFQEADINRFLKTFGNQTIDVTKPRFRLVWAPDQRELRQGEFNVFWGDIFLRTEKGVREMPKYPYIGERYVIEQWHPPEIAFSPELPDSNRGTYEPIYVFESGKGDRLPLNIKVVRMLMYAKLHNCQSEADKRCRMMAEEDAKDIAQQQYYEDVIDTSHMTSLLHFGEAIICPDIGVPSHNLRTDSMSSGLEKMKEKTEEKINNDNAAKIDN